MIFNHFAQPTAMNPTMPPLQIIINKFQEILIRLKQCAVISSTFVRRTLPSARMDDSKHLHNEENTIRLPATILQNTSGR